MSPVESVSATDCVAGRDRLDEGFAPLDRARGDRGFQRGDQDGVGNVVAEGVEADLAGVEGDLRRADQARGAVDDAHGAERRRFAGDVAARRRCFSSSATEPASSAEVRSSAGGRAGATSATA